MNKFVEKFQVIGCITPIDLATGSNAGDYINMAKYRKVTFIFYAGVGTAGQDPVLTFRQATDNAGTGVKDLATIVRVDRKLGLTLLSAIGEFTRTDQTASATVSDTDGGENEQLTVVDVEADMLDMANGFNHVICNIADTGATAGKIGCVLAIGWNARQDRDVLATAID